MFYYHKNMLRFSMNQIICHYIVYYSYTYSNVILLCNSYTYLVLKPKSHHLKSKSNLKNRTAPFIYGFVLVFDFRN